MKTKIKYLLVLVLASFVFAGCTTTFNGHNETKQWEYKTIFLASEGNGRMVEDKLNALGKDGWSLVSVSPFSPTQEGGVFYFKRPKQ